MKTIFWHWFALLLFVPASPSVWAQSVAKPLEIHVSPTGKDTNPGSGARPVATLAAAQRLTLSSLGKRPVEVLLHGGVYYLPETFKFTEQHSGTPRFPVVYSAAAGEHPILSGGLRLNLKWAPWRDGIFKAAIPHGLEIDQLFADGQRQPMARYPNYDPKALQFNGSSPDAISPARVARWSNPTGGYIHAMHEALWGDMHWRILGKKSDGTLEYEGGWQNNRPSPMHPDFRFVENIREELDSPGEWFHDRSEGVLYFLPPRGLDLTSASIEVVRLRHLIEFEGSSVRPVKSVILRGLTFRHAARTFMENREPILRSDWTVYRGGSVMLTGTEDVVLEDCDFDQVGGNAVFVNKYNRRTVIRRCLIRESGASGIAFFGDPDAVRNPLLNYGQTLEVAQLDKTPGPRSDEYPADCLVDDCLITRTGRVEKQTAPIAIDMARRITVSHCSIYDVPRAGINIGDGCWGGHRIQDCDVFETVLETGDHGSFNSWGRDRYWHPDVRRVDKQVSENPSLPYLDAVEATVLNHNRWRCDHGWDVDLDDGSSHFVICNNLFLNGGLKLREGYGRLVTNNIIVNNSLHPHVWFKEGGEVFTRNIVMGEYRPAVMEIAKWGKLVDFNLFTTSDADRTRFAAQGCDEHSIVADPQFRDPSHADFSVSSTSPALKLGFVNFKMDDFGVRSPRLRAIARTPEIPHVAGLRSAGSAAQRAEITWADAHLRELEGLEYSALGLSADQKGVLVSEASFGAALAAGLRAKDLIVRINDQPVVGLEDFRKITSEAKGGAPLRFEVIRDGKKSVIRVVSKN